jgi:hypothetical protein
MGPVENEVMTDVVMRRLAENSAPFAGIAERAGIMAQ